LDILEFLSAIGELFSSWRFYVCLILTFALVCLIYFLIPNQTVCLVLSIPLAMVGIGAGIVWQWRKD